MHIHALGVVKPDMCDLDGKPLSLDELSAFVKACIAEFRVGDGEWLPVLQWNPFEGNDPTEAIPTLRAALDAASDRHPIILWGNDAHHGAVNSAALAAPEVPIDSETLATVYAHVRDLVATDESGAPTGRVSEHARYIMRPDMDADMMGVGMSPGELMPSVAASLASAGITSIQDPKVSDAILAHYLWLAKNGDMTFRARTALMLEPEQVTSNKAINWAIDARASATGTEHLQVNAVKIFADGVLEGDPYGKPPVQPNAAMLDGFLQPVFSVDPETGAADIVGYVDPDSQECRDARRNMPALEEASSADAFKERLGFWPAQCRRSFGSLVFPENRFKDLVHSAIGNGFHVHVHAISDHAARLTADAFEDTADLAAANALTQSVAHLQIAKDDDVQRLGQLGAYAAFTYLWAKPEPEYEMTVIPFIDEVGGIDDLYNPDHYYVSNAYPFRSFLRAGGIPVFGSDVPVGSRDPRPFASMRYALKREFEGNALNPAESLDIHEAIAAFTINGAHLMGHADILGSLEVGKEADLIVIDRNLVDLAANDDAEAIEETRVLMTMFRGRVVYGEL
jgi:hypothetical protein